MGASASALPVSLAVEPGAEQSCWIQIRNTGKIVDEFVFEILGEAARWAELDPPAISLFPGAEGELKVTFRAPRVPTTPAGMLPFGLKVTSKQNPADSVVEEGALAIAPFEETNAELTPRTSRGRLVGKHELAFDNRGNIPVNTQIEGIDPDDLLTFAFKPPALVAAPGTATFSKVRARPRKRFLRGAPRTFPFQVRVAPEGGEPRVVDGAVVQEPLVPRWALPALLALAVLAALWAVLLKPQIESTAKDAVKDPLAAQQKAVDKAATDAADAAKSARQAQQIASKTPVPPKTPAPRVVARNNVQVVTTLQGTPTSFRLQVDCPPDCTVPYPVAAGRRFALTDIVFSNPNGDAGTLTLKRGDSVLFDQELGNFRAVDFHFVAPIVVPGGSRLALEVKCRNAAAPAAGGVASAEAPTGPCTASAFLAGFVQKAKKSAQKP
jgi:hypothetical protein